MNVCHILKLLEDIRKALTLKSTRKRMQGRNKMPETRKESQSTVLAEENQINVGKGNQTVNAEKSQEYEPGTLQTYRNGLQRYFLERPCPPAVDNFDLKKSLSFYFEGVSTMLSIKEKGFEAKRSWQQTKCCSTG